MPRYVSLKSDHVNVRAGPTKDNDVAWVYTRSGLPVEITAEFENWRRVRDSEGAEGWVYHSLLSGRRTAVITMKSKDDLAPLYDRADPASAVAARLQAGVVAQVKHCAAGWCHVLRQRFRWLDRTAAAVGRLRRREGGLMDRVISSLPGMRHRRHSPHRSAHKSASPRSMDTRVKPAYDESRSKTQRFLRSRTTMSTRAIS